MTEVSRHTLWTCSLCSGPWNLIAFHKESKLKAQRNSSSSSQLPTHWQCSAMCKSIMCTLPCTSTQTLWGCKSPWWSPALLRSQTMLMRSALWEWTDAVSGKRAAKSGTSHTFAQSISRTMTSILCLYPTVATQLSPCPKTNHARLRDCHLVWVSKLHTTSPHGQVLLHYVCLFPSWQLGYYPGQLCPNSQQWDCIWDDNWDVQEPSPVHAEKAWKRSRT